MITPALLEPVLVDQPDLLDAAVAQTFADEASPLTLADLHTFANGTPFTVPMLLAQFLNSQRLLSRFLSILRAKGLDLLPVPDGQDVADRFDTDHGGIVIGNVTEDDFALDMLAKFAMRAQAFRCRIEIDGQPMGSGALISPRLVLTAAHVIEKVLDQPPDVFSERVVVRASDGEPYPARLAWHLPCHEDEKTGGLPPLTEGDSHCDAALLRLDKPLGRLFGRIELPDPPADWTGAGRFALIHYPAGAERGLSIGKIRRDGTGDIRQFHNVNTDGGSSGGAGFDRHFKFLGLHQGRWQAFRRIVPYTQFAANTEFRTELESDQPPRQLWSLNGALDGHLIIGRQPYFEALTALVEQDIPMLRGVWVKRTDLDRTQGISFSYDILKGFLLAHGANHQIARLAPSLNSEDVVAELHNAVFPDSAPKPARSGVGVGETTLVAQDDDRIRALADRLEKEAESNGQLLWVYLENPPEGLLRDTQFQLEHLVEELMTRPNLRLILTGFETYDLLPGQFDDLADARRARAPGVLVEFLGTFHRRDVALTVREMSRDLGLGLKPAQVELYVDRALKDLQQIGGNTYDVSNLGEVARILREEAQKDFVVAP